MSEIIAFPLPSGPNFTIPDVGDENWGQSVTDYLVAIPNGVPPTSGTFTLTGDLYFGAAFGLVSQYFKSPTINPATAGIVRLAKTDLIDWRNNANSANLGLGINGSDQLTFNGNPLISSAVGNLTDAGTDGIVVTGGTGAVLGSGTSLAQHVADASHNGYLSSADWSTFNGKGAGTVSSVAMTVPTFLSVSGSPITSSGTLAVSLSGTALPVANGGTGQTTAGNLTDAGTDGITITGGTGCLHTTASISQHVADSTHNGYLSSTDWSTFNSAAGGGITSLTGVVTGTGPGATATSFAASPIFSGTVTTSGGNFSTDGAFRSSQATNQINFLHGGTDQYFITAPAPGSGIQQFFTIPDNSITNSTFALLEGAQTFSGAKTFTNPTLNLNGGANTTSFDITATGAHSAILGLSANSVNYNLAATGAGLSLVDTTNSHTIFTYTTGNTLAITPPTTIQNGLAMNSTKITGLASGTTSGDALAYGQDLNGSSITFSSTSGVIGTTTNNNAAAGSVGEYVETGAVSGTYPATGVYADAGSMSLTAGDWDVMAQINANNTQTTNFAGDVGISTTSGNSSAGLVDGTSRMPFGAAPNIKGTATLGRVRFSLASTTTIYFKISSDFWATAAPTYVGNMNARRVR